MYEGKNFKKAPELRPSFNIGACFDIPTGQYYIGPNGESVLNGGLAQVTGVAAAGNCFKSTIAHFQMLTAMSRYWAVDGGIYDTENSLTNSRLDKLAPNNLTEEDIENKITITDTEMYLDEYFDAMKEYGNGKLGRNKRPTMMTTPFRDRRGNIIKIIRPSIFEIDSLSAALVSEIDKKYLQKNSIGNKDNNIVNLRGGGAKTQFLVQLPGITKRYGFNIIAVAHLGEAFAIDPMNMPQKKLSGLKQNVKFKDVPEKFTFLTNNLWWPMKATVLYASSSNRVVKWPRHSRDNRVDDKDLQEVIITNLRGKNGASGDTFTIVVSQSEGVIPELTEFNNIKKANFGIEGNDQRYSLSLMPDVSLQRTTVRSLLKENKKLARACNFQSELCQIYDIWRDLDPKYICEPAELRDDLIKLGYDWNILLNTRGYWVFEEEESKQELPYLSTMDLLRMRAGEYRPYWYDKVVKKAAKEAAKTTKKEAGKKNK